MSNQYLNTVLSCAEEKKGEKNFDAIAGMESLFQDGLPLEIVKELTPEVRRQYFLWDEIMKREIELYPWLVLPVIKEIFNREYPDNGNIVLLSTEYTVSRIHERGEKLLHAIRSDLLLKVERDLYHFECQIEKDGKMVFRMLEYDVHIALTHGKMVQKNGKRQGEYAVFFPKSAVLYLGASGNVPEYETCTIYFQDGGSYLYKVPVMKVQGYSLKEIEERHLNILIPFLPIRFREQIRKVSGSKGKSSGEEKELVEKREDISHRKEERESLKHDMTEFLSECIMVLGKERDLGIISEIVKKDIAEFLWKACGYLLEDDAELYEEVSAEVEPAIKLDREIIQELRDSNRELQDNNRELQNRIDQELEGSSRRLANELKREGKSEEEAKDVLMKIFLLTEKEAAEKIRTYWKEE